MKAAQVYASPSTRRLARVLDVDMYQLARQLRQSRIEKHDLLRYQQESSMTTTGTSANGPGSADTGSASAASGQTTRPAPGGNSPADRHHDPARFWDIDHAAYGAVDTQPESKLARLAAANLGAAQQRIPAVTHHDQISLAAVERYRQEVNQRNNARQPAGGTAVRLTALAFHIKALASTLRRFPRFNASLSADGEVLHLKQYVSIGVAVDTEHGLMVPVIRQCDRKGLTQIASEVSDFATRAAQRKLRPDEMGGASMSLSNLGGIRGGSFTPIVNPPEVAILGITRAEMAPHWNGEQFEPVLMCPIALSYDHRVINGADAARFLAYYAGLFDSPRRLLL